MKMSEAMEAIGKSQRIATGFRVHFEIPDGAGYRCDFFPAIEEPAIELITNAQKLACEFANAQLGRVVCVYVIDKDWNPVSKTLNPRTLGGR